jgi:transformation/transcription domain-associated protein
LQALREADNANTAYSTALSLCQQLPEGWVSWGTHCDQMYQAQKNPVWLEYAVTCYLQVRARHKLLDASL